MYTRGLIPWNFVELAEVVPIEFSSWKPLRNDENTMSFIDVGKTGPSNEVLTWPMR